MSDEPVEINSWDDYAKHVEAELIPKLENSAAVMGLWSGTADVKMSTEIGYAVLMGKPIIVVAVDGAEVSETLAKVAYRVIRTDIGLDNESTRKEIAAALSELWTEIEKEQDA